MAGIDGKMLKYGRNCFFRAHSSVGQSHRLITGRSLVRGQVGPPNIADSMRREASIEPGIIFMDAPRGGAFFVCGKWVE